MKHRYNVVIVGAGPAGVICAIELAGKGLSVAIIDKSSFPRDKICGDALSADVISQFYRLPKHIKEEFNLQSEKMDSHGVVFVAPNYDRITIPFKQKRSSDAPGYIMKRWDFDNFLMEELKRYPEIDIYQSTKVTNVSRAETVIIKTDQDDFEADFIIGADGANSVVSRQLQSFKINKKHQCAGLRMYFSNVKGFEEGNPIELHFNKKCLPGYFWIFPLPNNQANVGLGIRTDRVSKEKLDVKEVFKDLLENDPVLKERFADAKPLETVKGFGLPMGSSKKPMSGDRFLLIGDAASLIDPFTGEGIGNALRSGRFAAEHIVKAFEINNFSAKYNKRFDKLMQKKMGQEFRVSYTLQRLLHYPWLFNFVVGKARKNESLKKVIMSMLDDIDMKKELTKPSFYFKLLFS